MDERLSTDEARCSLPDSPPRAEPHPPSKPASQMTFESTQKKHSPPHAEPHVSSAPRSQEGRPPPPPSFSVVNVFLYDGRARRRPWCSALQCSKVQVVRQGGGGGRGGPPRVQGDEERLRPVGDAREGALLADARERCEPHEDDETLGGDEAVGLECGVATGGGESVELEGAMAALGLPTHFRGGIRSELAVVEAAGGTTQGGRKKRRGRRKGGARALEGSEAGALVGDMAVGVAQGGEVQGGADTVGVTAEMRGGAEREAEAEAGAVADGEAGVLLGGVAVGVAQSGVVQGGADTLGAAAELRGGAEAAGGIEEEAEGEETDEKQTHGKEGEVVDASYVVPEQDMSEQAESENSQGEHTQASSFVVAEEGPWQAVWDALSRRVYFCNAAAGITQWHPPEYHHEGEEDGHGLACWEGWTSEQAQQAEEVESAVVDGAVCEGAVGAGGGACEQMLPGHGAGEAALSEMGACEAVAEEAVAEEVAVEQAVAAGYEKYWQQRYGLFSRFNEGVQLDSEAWPLVTPEAIAVHHAAMCAAAATSAGDAAAACAAPTLGAATCAEDCGAMPAAATRAADGAAISVAVCPQGIVGMQAGDGSEGRRGNDEGGVRKEVSVDDGGDEGGRDKEEVEKEEGERGSMERRGVKAVTIAEGAEGAAEAGGGAGGGAGVVVDAFCGVGGNTIHLAKLCPFVVAVDMSVPRLTMLRHNLALYGTSLPLRVDTVCSDFLLIAPRLKADVVFLSPPWGGPEYLDQPEYDIWSMLQPVSASALLHLSLSIAPSVAMYLPRNTPIHHLDHLARSLSPQLPCLVERNFLNGKFKAITAYFGPIAHVFRCHECQTPTMK